MALTRRGKAGSATPETGACSGGTRIINNNKAQEFVSPPAV